MKQDSDILLLALFLLMAFVTEWQNLCLTTGDLCQKAHTRQQLVTKMRNKSEKTQVSGLIPLL